MSHVNKSAVGLLPALLGVVAGRHEEVCEHGQLVLREGQLVFGPVVLVGPLEVLENLLDCCRDGDRVVEMVREQHQDRREALRDIVGTGHYKGAETKNTCMSEQNSLGLLGLEVGWILVPLGFLPDLLGDLPGELLEEQGGIRLGDEGAVEEPTEHLAGLLPHLHSLVSEQPGHYSGHPGGLLWLREECCQVGEHADLQEL